ncbi:MAG: zinc ABC transporter substrate-binding protein, partial [Verrucomicrobiota bacterium]
GQVSDTNKLRVVTSFLPIQSHTCAIAEEHAFVEQLLEKDSGPHDFQLTPATVRKLADADLFIINGAGIEDWLDELIKTASNKDLVIVDTSKGVQLLGNPEELGGDALAKGAMNDGSKHGGDKNPHIWLDPLIAIKQARIISNALQKADPANASAYETKAKAYIAELEKLDADYETTLNPLKNKKLVTFHEAFPYLADRYGLEYIGAISEFPERDPPPQKLAALVDKIKEHEIGVLFSEQGYAPGLLKKIADQTGAKVSQLDTLEVGKGHATAYLDLMRKNLEALQAAFSNES